MSPLTILYKGGRLPAWYQLTAAAQDTYQQAHVDLMLSIAARHRLQRLEGFRLLSPQGGWERFWIIQFPEITGAEAWIKAEVAPPYGRYGYYDYQLARPLLRDTDQMDNNQKETDATSHLAPFDGDPHQVPLLEVDESRVIACVFEWDSEPLAPDPPLDQLTAPYLAAGIPIRRLEGFQLVTPQADWQRVWLVELPDLTTAEGWLAAAAAAGQADSTLRAFQLTRPWAPAYFASWLAG